MERNNHKAWLYLLPAVLFLGVFMLYPLVVLGQYVFMAGDEFFSLSVVTVAVGTVFFVLYDFCLSACITTTRTSSPR